VPEPVVFELAQRGTSRTVRICVDDGWGHIRGSVATHQMRQWLEIERPEVVEEPIAHIHLLSTRR
jgi:hypothetical protein